MKPDGAPLARKLATRDETGDTAASETCSTVRNRQVRLIDKDHAQAAREKASASRATKVRPSKPTAE
jgi:hypothetical protein